MANLAETKLGLGNQSYPPVTIVVPLRNDAAHIGHCLESLAAQSWPKEKLEILVVDGASDDGSAKAVKKFVASYPNIRLLTNPQKITPIGRNIGIVQATGDYIAIIDAHSRIDADYIEQATTLLLSRADLGCVGGVMRTLGNGYLGKAIALVLSSPFGVGGSKFRTDDTEQFVDTVPFGVYRRSVFDKVGLFDERLIRNQDNEFNARLRKSGDKVLLTPKTSSYYYAPDTIYKFSRQAFRNGLWNIRMVRLVGRGLAWRHAAPLVFVLGLSFAATLGFLGRPQLLAIVCFVYLAAATVASIGIGRRESRRFTPFLPILFLLLHLSYGLGSVAGVLEHAGRFGRVARS